MRESRFERHSRRARVRRQPCVQRGALLMWYAGIDWANDHHDALVINEQGRQVGSLRVDHTPQGMTRLNTFLDQSVGADSKHTKACICEPRQSWVNTTR